MDWFWLDSWPSAPAAYIFLFHFHWKQTSFFCNFRIRSEGTTQRNQMNPINTVLVNSLIEEIQLELKGQTGSWRKVSEECNSRYWLMTSSVIFSEVVEK